MWFLFLSHWLSFILFCTGKKLYFSHPFLSSMLCISSIDTLSSDFSWPSFLSSITHLSKPYFNGGISSTFLHSITVLFLSLYHNFGFRMMFFSGSVVCIDFIEVCFFSLRLIFADYLQTWSYLAQIMKTWIFMLFWSRRGPNSLTCSGNC